MTALKQVLMRLYRCERGAEGLEKLLIIAAVVLPLLGLLLYFRSEIMDWVTGNWEQVRSESDNWNYGGGGSGNGG